MVAPMCHKFFPHFELFNESFTLSNFIFQKKLKLLQRKCADDNSNKQISHHATCKITVSYCAIYKIATLYPAIFQITPQKVSVLQIAQSETSILQIER